MKKIEFKNMLIDDMMPADYNPRLDLQAGDTDYENLKKSIEQFGFVQNIVYNQRTGHVVGGHQRIKVLKDLGYTELMVAVVDIDEDMEKALNIGLNKIEGDWDFLKLKDLMVELQDSGLDLDLTGFSDDEMQDILNWEPPEFEDEEEFEEEETTQPDFETLADRFLIPPFSTLDVRKGYWVKRKKAWISLGLKSEVGRGANDDKTQSGLVYANSAQPPEIYKAKNEYEDKIGKKVSWDEFFEAHPEKARQGGTSIFDPVLCEIAYRWFNISGGTILDPFSGGSVRGVVASYLGYDYTGIDLRQEQVSANILQGLEILPKDKIQPTWIQGNSLNVEELVPAEKQFDMIFSCPPYFDLEVYSDLDEDLSNKGDYQAFISDYRKIINASVKKLKNNRFACFVVGDVRDKRGIYYNFVSDTIQAFVDAGMQYYNEAILITQIGSLAIRINKQFGRFRKLGKTHQNVLIFYKGDPKQIVEEFGEFELDNDFLQEIIQEEYGEGKFEQEESPFDDVKKKD